MYYTTKDIMELLDVSVNTARKYMKQVNDEMRNEGYILLKGKVLKERFDERFGIKH